MSIYRPDLQTGRLALLEGTPFTVVPGGADVGAVYDFAISGLPSDVLGLILANRNEYEIAGVDVVEHKVTTSGVDVLPDGPDEFADTACSKTNAPTQLVMYGKRKSELRAYFFDGLWPTNVMSV